jgi:hypothetical protein
MLRFVALLSLAACATTTPAPIANQPAHPAPPAAPVLSVGDEFALSRPFPLVSTDGTVVVLAVEDGDGGRGYPNLRFVVKDRRDKILATHVVLAADEADGYLGDAELTKRLAPRIARANAWLAEQNATYGLVSLPALAVVKGDDGYADVKSIARDNLSVTWSANTLDISADKTPLVHRATPQDWLADKRAMPDGSGEMCENPAFLNGAAVDAARRIAVVTVSYTGTDTCWEPPDQQRVIAW